MLVVGSTLELVLCLEVDRFSSGKERLEGVLPDRTFRVGKAGPGRPSLARGGCGSLTLTDGGVEKVHPLTEFSLRDFSLGQLAVEEIFGGDRLRHVKHLPEHC